MENAATIYYKSKMKLNINASLLFINLLLKSTDLLKQASSISFSHRAIILGKSMRFILFFHILAIFIFLSKLKKVQVRIFVLCYSIYKLHTKKPYCSVFLIKYQITRCYRKIYLLLKYNDNANSNKATFR